VLNSTNDIELQINYVKTLLQKVFASVNITIVPGFSSYKKIIIPLIIENMNLKYLYFDGSRKNARFRIRLVA